MSIYANKLFNTANSWKQIMCGNKNNFLNFQNVIFNSNLILIKLKVYIVKSINKNVIFKYKYLNSLKFNKLLKFNYEGTISQLAYLFYYKYSQFFHNMSINFTLNC